MHILISGAGVAGLTLSYWLKKQGIDSTLVERASQLRTGGYVIDFWGVGYDVAERMGIVPALERDGYKVKTVLEVNADGKPRAHLAAQVFGEIAHGRYVSITRGDLVTAIYEVARAGVEIIFGDTITAIENGEDSVRVSFQSRAPQTFDTVVGADGLHSKVRELAFGPEEQFEKYLGYKAAAFAVRGYRPRDELTYVMHTEIGRQIARFTARDDQTMFFLAFADPDNSQVPATLEEKKFELKRRYLDVKWEAPAIMHALEGVDELYFDRVSQIHMGRQPSSWSHGRVGLVGDAAACVSLLAGEGAGLAMAEAYILARELALNRAEPQHAFAEYQQRMANLVDDKQRSAVSFAKSFAPSSRLGLMTRNAAMHVLGIPAVARLAGASWFKDNFSWRDGEGPIART